ncbi:splicing factor U2af large subunit A-like isoform X1 [Papaver somniferum]|uniref:splicing factor U2af large subunit A-like isoform X1 n=2 Tax=Papaver somniferum TaxID=3469 RepID=UPI000E6F8763|nr:splicing factor U2af large subunit A-like isoform X1 [Papaver somniferum]
MSGFDNSRDGNGETYKVEQDHGGGGSSPHDLVEDRDSHHKHSSRGSDRDGSRNRGRGQHRENDYGGYNRDYKSRSNDRGRRKERGGRTENNGFDRLRNCDYDRRGSDKDRDRKSRHRSRSRSKDTSRSPSGSRSRSKRTSGFDMAPPSTAVPGQLPGAPPINPEMFSSMFPFGSTPFGALQLMPAQSMTQQATRHARRVYVGCLPPLANEQTIATYFGGVMAAIGGNTAGPGDAVVNVYINQEKKFAFVEMRTVEEASNAMALDGIIFDGVSCRVRRPTDYNPSLAAALGPSQPSPLLNLAAVGLTLGATGGAEGPDRVFVGGLPYYFTDAQIRELLESFGSLRGFDLVKDRDTGNSKGYGFCVYQDPAVTDIACAALNGLKMGDKTLTVRRATASIGQANQDNILQQAQQHVAMQKMVLQAGGLSFPGIGNTVTGEALEVPTKVVCLTEVVTADELRDDGEYEEILEDMKDEGGKFGSLVSIIIPRPNANEEQTPGVGKVFLEYVDTTSSAMAKLALDGRKFGGNEVKAVYYPEDKFSVGHYEA